MIYVLILIGNAHAAWFVEAFNSDIACINRVIELSSNKLTVLPQDKLFCVPMPNNIQTVPHRGSPL